MTGSSGTPRQEEQLQGSAGGRGTSEDDGLGTGCGVVVVVVVVVAEEETGAVEAAWDRRASTKFPRRRSKDDMAVEEDTRPRLSWV